MVFGFVKQSGGHIQIESAVGTGTTIRIYLPRAVGDGEAESRRPNVLATGSEVILAVEDNAIRRRVLVRQLRDLGYAVLEAADGRGAVELLRGSATVDLLLTDIVMPGGIDCSDLAQIALQIRPSLKVLFTSRFPQTSFASGRFPQPQLLLSKPYRKAELAEMVRVALER